MSQAKFEKAVEIVQGLPKDGPITPSQDEKLVFYKYYKQATIGGAEENNTPAPGMMDFVGKAKYKAWKSLGDLATTSKEASYAAYVDELLKILKKSDTEDSKKHIAAIEAA